MSDYSWSPPPSGPPRVDVRFAIAYAWNRFAANWLPWVLISLPLLAGLYFQAISAVQSPITGSFGAAAVVALLTFIAGLFYRVVITRGALLEVDGRSPRLGDFFTIPNWGRSLLTALLVSVLTNLPGWVLPQIAGWFVVYGQGGGLLGLAALFIVLLTVVLTLAIVFFTFFAVNYTVDQQVRPFEAVKASFAIIRLNFRELIVLALVNAGIVILGALLIGLGLLVAVPLVMISSTYAYRVLALGPVAPVDPQAPPVGGYFPPQDPPYPPLKP